MTVCIAAICDGAKAIVVAADRMFTNPGLSVEFETEEQKIEDLGMRCVALAAGNSVHATEVLVAVRKTLGGNASPAFDHVAEITRIEYERVRNRKALESIVTPMIGTDFERFKASVPLPTYLEKQPQIYQQMCIMAQQHNLNVDLLLAGIDGDGAHLSHITHPAQLLPLQKLGHAAIGSGGLHAMLRLSLDRQSRQRGLYETLAGVYMAKRASEVAPGVGDATDIAIIDDNGVWRCTKEVVDELDRMHQSMTNRDAPNHDALKRICDERRANA